VGIHIGGAGKRENVLGKLPEVDVEAPVGKRVDPKTHTLEISLEIQTIPDPAPSDIECHVPNISSFGHPIIRDPSVAENL
jgi:hypothetical protein